MTNELARSKIMTNEISQDQYIYHIYVIGFVIFYINCYAREQKNLRTPEIHTHFHLRTRRSRNEIEHTL